MLKLLPVFLVVFSFSLNAQGVKSDSLSSQIPSSNSSFFKHVPRKGKMFLTWGWNRDQYTNSDIEFTGPGYDFLLHDVKASDRQTPFTVNYFNPLDMTIPQYQYRIGYYFNDNWSVSFGFNHMKYVMDQGQTVKIDGQIQTAEPNAYNDSYNNDDIVLSEDFLMFEHTDGLNYLALELERIDAFWVSRNKKFNASVIEGGGVGIMYPKSDVTLFEDRYDKWHLSGYGISGHVALRFDFFTHFYIQAQLQGGFVNMPDVITTAHEGARARQNFFFLEEMISFGGYINLFAKK